MNLLEPPSPAPVPLRRGPGPSPRDQERIRILEQHIDDEREAIARYDAVLEAHHDEFVTYLIELIADDEQRHHRLLREMLHHQQHHAHVDHPGSRVPWRTRPRERAALLEAVRGLQRVERRDLRELRAMRRRLRRERDGSLLPLLCELMRFDTKKHLRILRELERAAG